MTTETINTKKLFKQLDEATSALFDLLSSADEKIFYTLPFKNSWTIAQLASHVTKSNKAIAQALNMQGQPAERNAEERVQELKKMFLNYDAKYQSPEFILPSKEIYSKQDVLEKFKNYVEQLKDIRTKTNLAEVISLPAFGEITKFELLNFIVFHTMRHTHQLKHILHSLK